MIKKPKKKNVGSKTPNDLKELIKLYSLCPPLQDFYNELQIMIRTRIQKLEEKKMNLPIEIDFIGKGKNTRMKYSHAINCGVSKKQEVD